MQLHNRLSPALHNRTMNSKLVLAPTVYSEKQQVQLDLDRKMLELPREPFRIWSALCVAFDRPHVPCELRAESPPLVCKRSRGTALVHVVLQTMSYRAHYTLDLALGRVFQSHPRPIRAHPAALRPT